MMHEAWINAFILPTEGIFATFFRETRLPLIWKTDGVVVQKRVHFRGGKILLSRSSYTYRSPAATPLERLTELTDHSGGEDTKSSRWAFQPLSSADNPDSSGVRR